MSDQYQQNFTILLANALHDIKNSLAIVVNTADELSDEEAHLHDPRLQLIRSEGMRLNSEFVQLLSLYKIENKQYITNMDWHYVGEMLEELALENDSLFAYHKLFFDIDCDPQLEWCFDRGLIQGVLNSTLNNCMRYADSRIVLKARQEGDRLALSILDDGPGYPEDLLKQQRSQKIDFKIHHTGLGLYFARAVAELHQRNEKHGCLELSNPDAGGGCFCISLPG